MRLKQAMLFAALLAVLSAPAWAQKFTAALRGTVTDTSQAAVQGATVTLTDVQTGVTKATTTNAAGSYSFPDLAVGSYRVTVEKTGFRTAVSTNIELNVADTRAVNLQLEAGKIEEQITVEESAVAVQTIGGDVSGLVTGAQVRELPLNGRNFTQLALLMPGVSQPDNFNTKDKGLMTGVDMSVSGGTTMSNVWTVDGANNNDVGSNRTILIYPSVDAIEEFKVHRNNYGAEFGQAGGAQINIVTRRGANDFHGSTYYFGRNDGLNATNYFLKESGKEKEPLSVHDFGYTFGGPIMKDKLHFFASQEWSREQRGTVRTALVPTLAERQGDFSATAAGGCGGGVPVDPLTGQAFPGNKIPANRQSPGGAAFLTLFPAPNTPMTSSCINWVDSVTTPVNWRQENIRFDYALNASTQVMLRYTHDSWVNDSPSAQGSLWGDDPFTGVDSKWNQPGTSLTLQLSKTLGASAVNTLQFSYSANSITVDRGGTDAALNQELNTLIPPVFSDDQKHYGADRSHPVFWGGSGYPALWNEAPFRNNQDLFVLRDDYSQVFGKHFAKVGVLVSTNRKNEDVGGGSAFESPQFWGSTGIGGNTSAVTGNLISDFLLKDMTFGFSETSAQPRAQARWQDLEAYVNDSWKVHPQVTIDFGVRYSYFPNPYDATDIVASFDPAAFNPALGNDPCNGLLVPPGTTYCQDKGFLGGSPAPNRSLTENNKNLFAPRLGAAWDVSGDGKTALRVGLGQFFQRERLNLLLAQLGNPPFTQSQNGKRTLDSNVEPCAGCFALSNGVPANGRETKGLVPNNWQWNVSLQRQLVRNTTLELSYVGNHGVHLTRKYDANQVREGDLNANGVDDRLDYVRGVSPNVLRPFGVFGDAKIIIHDHSGDSIYHALQSQLVSRFGNGSQFQASYTFSKLIDNSLADVGTGTSNLMVTDLDNPALDRGLSPLSRKHVFNASLVLNGPSYTGAGGFKEGALGGWQFTSAIFAASGQPLTVFVGTVPGISNGAGGTGFADNIRPNLTGAPCRASGGNPENWLNPAAFTLTGFALGASGDAGRGVCTGPGIFQADMALYKMLSLGKRVKAQLRFEVFNVFNNTMFTDVNTVMNPTSVTYDTGSQATASTITGYALPGNFGVATKARDPRQAQFGIKLLF